MLLDSEDWKTNIVFNYVIMYLQVDEARIWKCIGKLVKLYSVLQKLRIIYKYVFKLALIFCPMVLASIQAKKTKKYEQRFYDNIIFKVCVSSLLNCQVCCEFQ